MVKKTGMHYVSDEEAEISKDKKVLSLSLEIFLIFPSTESRINYRTYNLISREKFEPGP